MAKKSSIEKQKRREILVQRNWEKRKNLKAIAQDLTRPEEERQAARLQLNKMPRDTAAVRLRNRCQWTGRVRGFLRKFKLSRLSFREAANFGLIPGIIKASW